jgi:hypothetical protein
MKRWYANTSKRWVIARGLITLAILSIVGVGLQLERERWVTIVSVPILLTLINLRARSGD